MPAPYDYLSQLPGNAFENALKGYQENLKAQEAAANKKMMESDLAALAGNTSASVQDYNKLMLKYPALQEQLGNSWKMMEGNRRQGLMDYGSKGLFALENNDTNTAIKLTEDYATALANSGKPDEAAQIRAVGELIKYDPNAARTSFKLSMMAGMGAEKYAELEAKKAEAQAGRQAPAAVQTYEYVKNLSPEQQKLFFKTQRGDVLKDVGGGYSVYDPVTGGMTPVFDGGKGLTPAQQDAALRKNIDAQEQFNRAVEIKQKAYEATLRLVGDPSAKPGTPQHKGNIAGVRANRGAVSNLWPNVSNSSVDAESDLTLLTNLLTPENLGLLEGVLSETDMKVLQSIGAGEILGSDKKTINAVRRMRAALGKQVEAGRAVQQEGFGNLPPPPISSLGKGNTPVGGLPPAPGGTPPPLGNPPVQRQQGASSFKEGDTATNPQTGQKITFRNGQWQ